MGFPLSNGQIATVIGLSRVPDTAADSARPARNRSGEGCCRYADGVKNRRKQDST